MVADTRTSVLKALMAARDELSLRSVRTAELARILAFPLAVILSDSLYRDWGLVVLGMDAPMLQSLLYGLAWLLAAAVPFGRMQPLLKAGAWSASVLVLPCVLLGGDSLGGLLLVSAFQFCGGLAAASGFHSFCYRLNNAERWLAMMIVCLYYGLSWLLYDLPGSGFLLLEVLPVCAAAGLALCAAKASALKADAPMVSMAHGSYSVLVLAFAYYLVSLACAWLQSSIGFAAAMPYGIGMLLGLACVALMQIVLNRNVWHLWNVYLLLTVAAMLLALLAGPEASNAGSLLYGLADNMGYLAMLYLVGGVACMSGKPGYFRVTCILAFLFAAVIPPLLQRLLDGAGTGAPVLAVATVFACIGVYLLLTPLLQRKVFAADWADGLYTFNPAKYPEQTAAVEAVCLEQPAGLTPRERDVMTLLLTEAAPKQIAYQLKISTGTFNFHSANLYRKLGVNSRVELLSRYAR